MRIIKRKRKNKEYYYLQNSYRKQGKVVTREKYLGKKIPENIELIKTSFLEECRKVSLFALFEKISTGFQKEWQRYPKSMKNKVKQQIAIAFTYNTNAIEGSKITLDETRELVERRIAPNKPIDDIKETEAHVKLFLDLLEKKQRLSNKLILDWHNKLFQETKRDIAGEFREYIVKVGDYRAPDWQDVKNLMEDLITFYNKNKNMNPVELAAKIHYRFEKIHPFADGNGRVGRLIMNHILWHSKYPMLIIEYNKRKSYYKALGGKYFDEPLKFKEFFAILEKEENKFLNYFTRRYLRIHKKYLKA